VNTLLYNTATNTAGDIRSGRYIVDGKTGQYPPEYVELVVQEPQIPSYNSRTQNLKYSDYFADIPNLLWTRTVTVEDKSQEEIDEINRQEIDIQKEQIFNSAIEMGYQIPNTDIYLKMSDDARVSWNQLLTLINEMISLGNISADTPLQIADKNNVLHVFTVQQIKNILTGLGFYYYHLWVQRHSNS